MLFNLGKYKNSGTADPYEKEKESLDNVYSRGELVLRSTQTVVTLVMIYGVLAHTASLLLPFLVWTPFQALTSLIMFTMAVYAGERRSIFIGMLAAWDVFAWGVVQSGRQMMFFDYILEAKFDRYLVSTLDKGKERDVKDLRMEHKHKVQDRDRHHDKHKRHRKAGGKIKDKVGSLLRTTKRNIQ